MTEGQLWQKQGEQWRLAGTKRSDATKLQQPASTSKVIYAPGVDAHAEIKHALQLAAKGHKRVLVVFGANWCYDCHVLDLAFLRTDIAGVLQQNFEVVHLDVGEGDKNQDLMAEYQVPMKRAFPQSPSSTAMASCCTARRAVSSRRPGPWRRRMCCSS